MPQQTADQLAYGDKMYFHRLGNLAAIDDMVGKLIEKLDEHDLLDNTYIIYTTDNGALDSFFNQKTQLLTSPRFSYR